MDSDARRNARITIAAECSALERGASEGLITAAELEERRDRLIPAINALITLTRGKTCSVA